MRFPAASPTMMVVLAYFALVQCFCQAPAIASSGDGDSGADKLLHLGLRGVYFVPNHGQWPDDEVRFGLTSHGLDVAFRDASFTMEMRREVAEAVETLVDIAPHSMQSPTAFETLTLSVTFPGSNDVLPQGTEPRAARFNYFVGGNGRQCASDVPSFGAVIYEDLYDGIDLYVTGNDAGILKYEFHVAPGVDYSQIRIAYDGIDSLGVTDSGDVQIETSFGTLLDAAPVVWQEIDGRRHGLTAAFQIIDESTYSIALLSTPDPAYEIVIDPPVRWMIYLGGTDDDAASGVTVDGEGNVLASGGWTRSSNFIGRGNAYRGGGDNFICKVNSSGTLVWMTYLGGSSFDQGAAVTTDSLNNVFLTGWTWSADFPMRTNQYNGGVDAFVLKLSPAGSLLWMTYLGGSGYDQGFGIVVDSPNDRIFIGGDTTSDIWTGGSTNKINGVGTWDAFAAAVTSTGTQLWMTYLGGSADDRAYRIALDAGNLFLTGTTDSSDFVAERTNNAFGGQDAFIVRVPASNGFPVGWMTYLGGTGDDFGSGLALDGASAFVTGWTGSTDFFGAPNINGSSGGIDAFVVEIPLSTGLTGWMTYLGGTGDDYGYAVAMDCHRNAIIVGHSSSTDFVGADNVHHGVTLLDAFVCQVTSAGAVLWATYLGGARDDQASAVAMPSCACSADIAYVTGWTRSTNFDRDRGNSVFQGGAWDAYLLRLPLSVGVFQLVVDTCSCPNMGPIVIRCSGAAPLHSVALLYARNRGSFVIPSGPCAGLLLCLGNPVHLVAVRTADPNGDGKFTSPSLSAAACGGSIQAVDVATCKTSNVATFEYAQ